MIPLSQVRNGIAAYADQVVLPGLPVGPIKRAVVSSTVVLLISRLENLITPYLTNETLKTMKLVDGDKIDIEAIKNAFKSQVPIEGLKVSVPLVNIDLTFKAPDIEEIYKYIKEAPYDG